MYSITPCDVVTTKTITSFKIDRIEISLFRSAVITVVLLDSANSILDVKFINMAGEDYSKWSADDTYVIEFIKQNLGFSDMAAPPQVETPVEEPVVETPVEEPVVETPVEEPVVETPVEEPVVETPVEETVVETPVEETPVEETVVQTDE